MCISKKLTHYSNDLYSKTPGRMDNSTKPYHDLTIIVIQVIKMTTELSICHCVYSYAYNITIAIQAIVNS